MPTIIDWLESTRSSAMIKNIDWIIPTVQTVHILSISIVMASVVMLNMRILGFNSKQQPLAAAARRYVPWVWITLIVLLLTGSTLIVGEPARSLQNPAFLLKMGMLLMVLLLLFVFQKGLRKDDMYWERTRTRRTGVRTLAIVSLGLWAGIVFAGRWIAYIITDAG